MNKKLIHMPSRRRGPAVTKSKICDVNFTYVPTISPQNSVENVLWSVVVTGDNTKIERTRSLSFGGYVDKTDVTKILCVRRILIYYYYAKLKRVRIQKIFLGTIIKKFYRMKLLLGT